MTMTIWSSQPVHSGTKIDHYLHFGRGMYWWPLGYSAHKEPVMRKVLLWHDFIILVIIIRFPQRNRVMHLHVLHVCSCDCTTGSGVIQTDIETTDEHYEESPQKRNPHAYILGCSAQVSVILPFPIYVYLYIAKFITWRMQYWYPKVLFKVVMWRKYLMQRSIVNTKIELTTTLIRTIQNVSTRGN